MGFVAIIKGSVSHVKGYGLASLERSGRFSIPKMQPSAWARKGPVMIQGVYGKEKLRPCASGTLWNLPVGRQGFSVPRMQALRVEGKLVERGLRRRRT